MPCGSRKVSPNIIIVYSHYVYFGSFGITGLILSQFENKVPLEPMLGAVNYINNNKLTQLNESVMFV